MSGAVLVITPEQARRIVANPAPRQNPMIYRLAWDALKTHRGERVIQSRRPRSTPDRPGAA